MLQSMKDKCFDQLLHRLGEEIKSLRLNAGLSQEALALEAEIDRTYISQLERGVANPSLIILFRISNVLKKELKIAFLEHSLE